MAHDRSGRDHVIDLRKAYLQGPHLQAANDDEGPDGPLIAARGDHALDTAMRHLLAAQRIVERFAGLLP